MPYETLIVEKENRIAIVKLNRPPVNSLNAKAYTEIYEVFCELENDESVKAIVLTGSGDKAFAAGLDVKEVAGKTIPAYFQFGRISRRCIDKVASCEKPTIAALFGFVFGGGCELALACDLRIAATDASLGCPEVNLGIIPGSGGTQRLPRLIGVAKAKELLLMGRTISGDEAYRIGLVNKAVPKEAVLDEAKAWAEELASKPRVAVSLIKTAIDNGMNVDLPTAVTFENECFVVSYVSEDGREGMNAFAEKRKPSFKDR
ncbi:MAG: putative enoyl-CoA hydratase echA8 [Syntrophorhabdaceae bacterium PtaU1.Bin034]|jgi:enoyl-CoA hydratase|nr:MAG: putative enoyl-CoA hydratase echA8 [Syntrophorhabdaceae bacterium PtaU1.Bin034]